MLFRLNAAIYNLDALLTAHSAELYAATGPVDRALVDKLVDAAEAAIAAARGTDRAPSAQYGPITRRLRGHEEEVAS